MKKRIAMVLLAVLLLVASAACGQPAAETAAEPAAAGEAVPAASEAAQPAETSDEVIEFEFYHGVGGDMSKLLEEMITEYNGMQSKYVCKSVYFSSYDEAFKGFQAASAAKNPPALLLGGVSIDDARKGMYADVAPFAKEDPNFTWDDYAAGEVAGCMVGDAMYLMPFYGSGWLMFYDKIKMAELSLDPDVVFSSWESVAAMANEVTQKDANGDVTYYGFEPMWYSSFLSNAAASNGGRMFSEDGKTATVNTPEWVEVYEMFRKGIHEDKSMGIHYGGQGWEAWYKTMDDVMEGRALAFTGTCGDLQVLDWTKVDAHLMPNMEGKGPWSQYGDRGGVAIPAAAPEEQQRAAFDFYKFFTSPENGAKWSIGTGYIPANLKSIDAPEYVEFLKTAPYMKVAFEMKANCQPPVDDLTNGKADDALSKACDQVMIEGIPAQQALDEANATIQAELDLLA